MHRSKSNKPIEQIPSKLITYIGNRVAKDYSDKVAADYRKAELRDHVSGRMWAGMISQMASSFSHRIAVLDLGCGTGRYFHSVTNAERYVGVDISPAMLELAKKPVRKSVVPVQLIQGDIYNVQFRPRSFDLIFSIGVLGDHAPFTVEFCNKVWSMLKPGGKIFFTVMDAQTEHSKGGMKRKLALAAYSFLPSSLKGRIEARIGNFKRTEEEVRTIINASAFQSYRIMHTSDLDPNHEIWDRFWFICEAMDKGMQRLTNKIATVFSVLFFSKGLLELII